MLQRVRDTHIAAKHPVEIFRTVAGKLARQVFNTGVGGGDAVIEGKAVDEGFKRRARRAGAVGEVDPSAGALTRGGADQRPHGAGRHVNDNCGDLNIDAFGLGAGQRDAFQFGLQGGVEGGADILARAIGKRGIGAVPGAVREIEPAGRHGERSDFCGFTLREDAVSGEPGGDPVARLLCLFGAPVRAAHFRRLGQRDQQCNFVRGQTVGLMAEIAPAGRAHAFQVTAIRRKR